MQNLSRYNDGYRYILTCSDVFSQRVFAIPLKDKRGTCNGDAFDEIISEKNTSVHSDGSRLGIPQFRSLKRVSIV